MNIIWFQKAENGISGLLDSKIFLGTMPQDLPRGRGFTAREVPPTAAYFRTYWNPSLLIMFTCSMMSNEKDNSFEWLRKNILKNYDV